MSRDPLERRKQIDIVLVVLAVAIGVSFLVAIALVYMARTHPHF
jgi:hypothetical protein